VTDILMCVEGRRFRVRGDRSADISVPLDFHGRQPSHFCAPPATAEPVEFGGFVGDTRQGGSCNCEVLTLVPHCNGTHTESARHLVTDSPHVASLATDALVPALLLSVPTRPAGWAREGSFPEALPGDQWVTADELKRAAERVDCQPQAALVVRTLPNDRDKCWRDYGRGETPAYFSLDAVNLAVDWDVRHLLIDLPSLDRSQDQGKLSGHRRFWGLPAAGPVASDPGRPDASITEMIFVPDDLPDGLYALSLQIAPFVADAAPSRPLLFPLEDT